MWLAISSGVFCISLFAKRLLEHRKVSPSSAKNKFTQRSIVSIKDPQGLSDILLIFLAIGAAALLMALC